MIKIIAILDNVIGDGGGFDQSLNAIVQMQRLSSNRFDFEVFTTQVNNVDFLNRLDIKAIVIKVSIYDRFLAKFSLNIFWQSLQARIRVVGPLEKKLIQHGCDIVYFLTPDYLPLALQKLNYIHTVWDLCHRETPEFPEVRNFNSFLIREKIYNHSFGPALFTLTDSDRLSDMASQYYGVERNRFIAMPFSPMPFIEKKYASEDHDVLNKYNLKVGYYYYPAQFWAHKNHIRILQALIILRDVHSYIPQVLFTGKDYGNLKYIKKFIKSNNLDSQVKIIGFVPSEDMRGLYKNSIAVVMPTYFGPTNLPPLEAWLLGVPLIYSKNLADQTGDAALLIDPDNSLELSEAMISCTKIEVVSKLVSSGYIRIDFINYNRSLAENKMYDEISKFISRRQCWE